MRDYFKGAGFVFLTVLLALVLIAGVWAVTVAWAPWKGEGDVRKATQGNAAYRMASYDWYFDQCNAVVAVEQKIEVQNDERKQTKDEQRRNQLTYSITALQNQRIDLINEYNANADKETTRAQFKDDSLPAHIDADQKETSCAA